MESKNNRNTSNNRGNWNHLRIIHKISENITRKHDQTACNPTTAQSPTVTCHFTTCLCLFMAILRDVLNKGI